MNTHAALRFFAALSAPAWLAGSGSGCSPTVEVASLRPPPPPAASGAIAPPLSSSARATAPAPSEKALGAILATHGIPLVPSAAPEFSVLRYDLAPGAEPGAAHRAGTVFVALADDKGRDTVTEWDLATRTAVNRSTLALGELVDNLRLLRRGATIHVMAWNLNGSLYHAQLGAGLQVVRAEKLGSVSISGPDALAADDSLAVVLANGVPDDTGRVGDPSGLFAVAYDASGRRLARRMLQAAVGDEDEPSFGMHGNLAVVNGHAYVVLRDEDRGLRILQLSRDLRTEREAKLSVAGKQATVQSLDAVDGGLRLALMDEPDVLAISLDLSRVTRQPRSGDAPPMLPEPAPPFPGDAPCGTPLHLGSELVALCLCGGWQCLTWAPAP